MSRSRVAALVSVAALVVVGLVVLRARADAPVACPEGARRVEARSPSGLEQWCERPGQAGRVVRDGPYRAWYPSGRLKIEGQLADGLKTGAWTYWHGNGIAGGRGQASEAGEYRAGREHGRWMRWHSLGSPREAGEYRDGVRQGRWAVWSEIGVPLGEGEYRDGQRTGVWQRWNAKGEACPPEDVGPPVPASDERAGVSG